jgi:hypothetical protein
LDSASFASFRSARPAVLPKIALFEASQLRAADSADGAARPVARRPSWSIRDEGVPKRFQRASAPSASTADSCAALGATVPVLAS